MGGCLSDKKMDPYWSCALGEIVLSMVVRSTSNCSTIVMLYSDVALISLKLKGYGSKPRCQGNEMPWDLDPDPPPHPLSKRVGERLAYQPID